MSQPSTKSLWKTLMLKPQVLIATEPPWEHAPHPLPMDEIEAVLQENSDSTKIHLSQLDTAWRFIGH